MPADNHALVSEATLLKFVSGHGFQSEVSMLFRELDADEDGYLSRVELRHVLESLRLFDDYTCYEERHGRSNAAVSEDDAKERLLYDALFEKFDADGDGLVNADEFTSQMHDIMQAIAYGLRGCPLSMLLHNDSIFARAVQHEQQQEKEAASSLTSQPLVSIGS